MSLQESTPSATAASICPVATGAQSKTSFSIQGTEFTVECGWGYYGDDVKDGTLASHQDSLSACLQYCNAVCGCEAIEFDDQAADTNCWPKTARPPTKQTPAAGAPASAVTAANAYTTSGRDGAFVVNRASNTCTSTTGTHSPLHPTATSSGSSASSTAASSSSDSDDSSSSSTQSSSATSASPSSAGSRVQFSFSAAAVIIGAGAVGVLAVV